MSYTVNVLNRFSIGGNRRFVLIAGPCAIESEEMTMETAAYLKSVCDELGIDLLFKSSFDKANRTSADGKRGIGMKKGLEILQKVKDTYHLPIVTDVHESHQCEEVAKVADVLQIPAFLCRQTDLLLAAANTGKIVNVKKGQFLAPWDMKNVAQKLASTGNNQIMLCERGSSFGYNNLVVDMTGLVEMKNFGYPIVFDATHAVQKPGGQGSSTGGNREMVPYLMRAALAIGVDAIFAEVHPDPDHAFSDGPNQIRLDKIKDILKQAVQIDDLAKSFEPVQTDNTKIEIKAEKIQKEKIKLFLTDVDGVLTDAGMYYTENGDELKKFNTHDGMGLQILKEKGVSTGIITSEDTQIVERRFKKLKLDYLYQGKREGGKLQSALEICNTLGISLAQTAYIGDDINCMELLSSVGLAACPASAVDRIKEIPGIIQLRKNGGEGVVREFIEYILRNELY